MLSATSCSTDLTLFPLHHSQDRPVTAKKSQDLAIKTGMVSFHRLWCSTTRKRKAGRNGHLNMDISLRWESSRVRPNEQHGTVIAFQTPPKYQHIYPLYHFRPHRGLFERGGTLEEYRLNPPDNMVHRSIHPATGRIRARHTRRV